MSKIIRFLKFIFHFSILLLIVLSLFPGSLIGLMLFGDLGRQPSIVDNPFGTAINHFIYYFYVSMLGLCIYTREKNFEKLAYSLFFLSIILELTQLVIPNRSFQLYDLIANFLGVLVAYFLVKIYLTFKKND
tara:strand:+ start:157 stop:552 length:396 start_codon:yes stop_codon:yes gene_type:complete